jgi:hypothetical protein
MQDISVLDKAKLCMAIVVKQAGGEILPERAEDKALRLMSLPDETLAKMAREAGLSMDSLK